MIGSAFWGQHGGHVLLLGLPTVAIGGIALTSDIRARLRSRAPSSSACRRVPASVLVAAGFSLLAGFVHGSVCPEHFNEAFGYGLFFLFAATSQTAWAALVVARPHRWLLGAGAAGNLAVVALWLFTRTTGLPLGPERGEVESIGALDVLATVAELGVVVSVLLFMSRFASQRVTTVET